MSDIKPQNSLKMVLILGIILCALFGFSQRWKYGATLKGDVVAYYSYLPAVIIEGDISMEYSHHDPFFGDKIWGLEAENGGKIQKYTMGLSFLYLPFFLLAHLLALILGFPADGYSPVYEFCIQFSAIFYGVLGLLFTAKILNRYLPVGITNLTLVCLLLGTNLLYYMVGHGPMPHVYLFFLLAFFAWQMIRVFEDRKWKNVLLMALAGGLAVMIRPVHLLIFLLPVLYGWKELGGKGLLDLLFREKAKIGVIVLICMVLWLPQMMYWKYMTGSYFFWSYDDEGFFWGNPKLVEGLFGFRKGWLLYTPMMVLAWVGMVFLRKHAKSWSVALPVIHLISIYVIVSWWCWWYGGSFGQRPFVDFYGWLALPIGLALYEYEQFKWENIAAKITIFGAGLFFLIAFNVFQTYQYTKEIIHYDAMTYESYKAAFLQVQAPEGYETLLAPPDYEAAKRGDR